MSNEYQETPTDALKVKERLSTARLFHQSTPERIAEIRKSGFQRNASIGAGNEGPLRGIFLKETQELLSGAGIGQSQIEVNLDTTSSLLDLRVESPPSFAEIPRGVDYTGYQDMALVGWLERQGHQDLAQDYMRGIRRIYRGNYEDLNQTWPKVESLLRDKYGFDGVRYIDRFIDDAHADMTFDGLVIFNAEKITPNPNS